MTRLADLDTLTHAEKDALILALWAQVQQIEGLKRRIAELETRLGEPPKTSDNSSLAPSQGRKGDRASGGKRGRKKWRKGHGGGGRRLHSDPDQRVVAMATECPHCRTPLAASDQKPQAVYDKIDLSPLRPCDGAQLEVRKTVTDAKRAQEGDLSGFALGLARLTVDRGIAGPLP